MIRTTVLVTAPEPAEIHRAVEILARGGLVAFPTETVYGLGARADHPEAIAGIYAAKGRPSHNPLIVHCGSLTDAKGCAAHWSANAQSLAEAFWPGPLTIVVPRAGCLPESLATGRETVALRCPAHPVATALLAAAPFPIAAPSANPSGRLSPVTAEHVFTHLSGRIDMVLDGGPCPVGIESTVVDASGDVPRVLRPGSVGSAALQAVCPDLVPFQPPHPDEEPTNHPQIAPGQSHAHYAPMAELRLVRPTGMHAAITAAQQSGRPCGLVLRQNSNHTVADEVCVLPTDPVGYAAGLFAALHQLDAALGAQALLLVEAVPEDEAWLAVRDRLVRAATPAS